MSIEDRPPLDDPRLPGGEQTRPPAAGGLALPAPDPTALVASTRERVRKVLGATDDAAQSILEAAKAEANAHVRETQRRVEQLARARMEKLSTVTEDLLGQADRVRQEVEGLRKAVDGAAAALAADLGLASGEAASEPIAAPPATEAASAQPGESPRSSSWLDAIAPLGGEDQPSAGPDADRTGAVRESGLPSEVIEIFVLKMLATGSDRAAIERRLSEEFDVEDPSAVLERLGLSTSHPGGQA